MNNNSPATDQERKYRIFYLDSDIKRARLGLAMLLIPIIAYFINDYILFGYSSQSYSLWILRALLFSYTLFLIFYLKRIKNYENYDKLIVTWELIATTAIVIINLTRPALYLPDQVIISVIYIFIICLIIPIRILYQTISALIIAISVLWLTAIYYNVVSLTAVLSLILACSISLLISRQLSIYRQQGFQEIENREKAEKALKISEERFRGLVESTSDWIWQVDQNGVYTYASPKVKDILGYTPEEVVGKTPFDLIVGDETEKVAKVFVEIANKKEAFSGLENWNVHKNGSLVLLETSGVPIIDGDGQLIGYRGIDRDITERKKVEEELAQSKTKLQEYATRLELLVEERTKQLRSSERMAAIGETAGMVGHDLRNPLQTITSELYLAKSELSEMSDNQKKKEMIESLDSISDQVSYMDKIVSDLQTFVKPVEPQMQIVKLKPLAAALLAQTNIPKNVQTNIQIEENQAVKADPQLLKRVLINLVTNAVQAMPEGGELFIKAYNSSGHVQIVVEDTGTGIPDEIKPKIFAPLFTTKSKGQGFGLAVCKRVIEAQGGTITFESQQGRGTKFIISLPLHEGARGKTSQKNKKN